MSEKTIPIHEHFNAFQGEGDHLGRSAYFIRTFGCPVHCPWCDSAGTWHKDYIPNKVERFSVGEISAIAIAARPSMVVITGGEPTVQPNLQALVLAIKEAGIPVHIETCGAYPFCTADLDWITLSPKRDKMPTKENLLECSEIKLIVDHPSAIEEWVATLDTICKGKEWEAGKTLWLHPEWSQRSNPQILNAISNYIKRKGEAHIKAGYQMHKLYQVDALDPNAKPTSPLGGNPELGY